MASTASCTHCGRVFEGSRGLFGRSAASLRDDHAVGCAENPRNICFCGRIFPNSTARDGHARTCSSNPSNRFNCSHCSKEFVSTFGVAGLFSTDGKALRDAHAEGCKENPANTCFCGQLFPNPAARNAHALKCEANPANCFKCQHCQLEFLTTFSMLGFKSNDGRAERDAHQVSCEKNPRNACFCGVVYPNPAAREKHAVSCEMNPVNRFDCRFCKRLFVTRYRVMGLVAVDGQAMRDAHAESCEQNPANVCFCGQIFQSAKLRDRHALRCQMNPVNRFSCQYCKTTFTTKYGFFTSVGNAERDAHVRVCKMNPANANCEHCGETFVEAHGLQRWMQAGARRRCAKHKGLCGKNPQNRFACSRCGRCFATTCRGLHVKSGKELRDVHERSCDVIPCSHQAMDVEFGDWWLLTENEEQQPLALTGTSACTRKEQLPPPPSAPPPPPPPELLRRRQKPRAQCCDDDDVLEICDGFGEGKVEGAFDLEDDDDASQGASSSEPEAEGASEEEEEAAEDDDDDAGADFAFGAVGSDFAAAPVDSGASDGEREADEDADSNDALLCLPCSNGQDADQASADEIGALVVPRSSAEAALTSGDDGEELDEGEMELVSLPKWADDEAVLALGPEEVDGPSLEASGSRRRRRCATTSAEGERQRRQVHRRLRRRRRVRRVHRKIFAPPAG